VLRLLAILAVVAGAALVVAPVATADDNAVYQAWGAHDDVPRSATSSEPRARI
jgi:hypothetical protein